MAIVFQIANKVIFIESPQTDVTIQDLHNAIVVRMDDPDFMVIPDPSSGFKTIHETTGKQDLLGGTFVGLTLNLFDDWRIEFEGRAGPGYTAVRVSGGNLTTQNSFDNNPIKPSAFTQVQTAQASSATLQGTALLDTIKFLIETQNPDTQAGFGDAFYVNVTNGNDGLSGLSPENALLTVNAALAKVTVGASDTIFLLSNAPTGNVIIDEQFELDKARTIIRGPGGNAIVFRNNTGIGNVVTISSPHCEVSGFGVVLNQANVAGSGIFVGPNGTQFVIKDMRADDCGFHGFHIEQTSPEKWVIRDSWARDCLHGLHLEGQVVGQIKNCRFMRNSIGIHNASAGAITTVSYIEDSSFDQSSVAGIRIESTVTGFQVRGSNTFSSNAISIVDNGTRTVVEVWDALNIEHETKREFTSAAVDTAVGTRNVGAGKLDYVTLTTRIHGDVDWANPISVASLYAWYTTLGDDNPIRIGENG